MFKCFCFNLKVWIIASIYNSEHQAALRDHDHHLLLRTCDNQKYYSSFNNLHPMQNTSMQCYEGLKKEITEFKLTSPMIPRWGGRDNQNTFWRELPAGTWHWLRLTGWDWELMRGNWSSNIRVSDETSYTGCNIFSWVACISVRWCRSWFWLFWWNWSQNNLFWVLNV